MEEKLGFRLKWLAVSSFEMEFGSTTVVSDPYITHCKGTDLTWEAVEKCNLITLSHAHWDHITDIPALLDKFNPRLLCGDKSMLPMAEWLNCKISRIYPMYPDTELDFGGVTVRALYGRHTELNSGYNTLTSRLIDGGVADLVRDFPDDPYMPTMAPLQGIGSLEYRNYLFTLPSGKTVFVWGGAPTIEQRNMFRGLNPDVAILQLSGYDPASVAQMGADVGARVIIPHHMDLSKTPEEYLPRIEMLREEFKKRVPQGEWFEV